MKRISTFTRSLYIVNALLVINAITVIGTYQKGQTRLKISSVQITVR